MNKRQNKGITLIALVITIIVLLILAGIVMYFVLGENGIINRAKIAKNEYEQSAQNELVDLNKIDEYIATTQRGQITIDEGTLTKMIDEKVAEALRNRAQPTGVKKDTWIQSTYSKAATFTGVTTMNGFTNTNSNTEDSKKIDEYLSYSQEKGYTVLKGGWYYFSLYNNILGSQPTDLTNQLRVNEEVIGINYTWSSASMPDVRSSYITLWLNQGDVFYFYASGAGATASKRMIQNFCYPMF